MDASQIKHQGVLTKRGRVVKNWLQRWFILTPAKLLYFQEKPGTLPTDHARLVKGTMPLKDATVVLVSSTVYGREHCFQVSTADRTLALQARNKAEAQAWMSAIQDVIDTLSGKKAAAAPTPAAATAAAYKPVVAAAEEQKTAEKAPSESSGESEDEEAVTDNVAAPVVEETKTEVVAAPEPAAEPEPTPQAQPEPEPQPQPQDVAEPESKEADPVEERQSEDSGMGDFFRPSLAPAADVVDTSSPAFLGMNILKKTTKESKYRIRFCWIDQDAKSVHWSKKETRDPPSKELLLNDIMAIRKGAPQRSARFGGTGDLEELGLTLAMPRGDGIDLKFQSTEERDEWHQILDMMKNA